MTLIIYSVNLESWPCHYDGERDQLCLRHIKRACRFCSAGQRQRWHWYAIAKHFESSKIGLGVITGGAFAFCSDLQDRKDNARGSIVYLERFGSQKSAVKARVEEQRVAETNLADEPYTVKQALWQIWSVPKQLALLDQVEAQQLADRLAEAAERALAEPPHPIVDKVTSRVTFNGRDRGVN